MDKIVPVNNEFHGHINTIIDANLKGTLAIFIGAGISKTTSSNLKDWAELISELKREINDEKEQDYLKIAQLYYLAFDEHKYYAKIKNFFPDNIEPSIIHEKIFNLNPQVIITTNWDTILENAIKKYGLLYDVICSDQDLVKSTLPRKLIKMHGDFAHHNFVFKEEDYINYNEKFPLIENYIKGIMTTHTVLFLGYSYNDIDVKHIVKWIQNRSSCKPPMYMTVFKDNESQRRYLENYQITTLFLQQELEPPNTNYPFQVNRLLYFINMLNKKSTSYNVSSDEDIVTFVYNKLSVLSGLQAILFTQLENTLTNCEIVFREREPALRFAKDLRRTDFDEDLQTIYYRFLGIVRARVTEDNDIVDTDINIKIKNTIFAVFSIFYKAGVRRVILTSEMQDTEEYLILNYLLPKVDNAFFDDLICFRYIEQKTIDIIEKKMNEAYILYQKNEFVKSLALIEDIIVNCRISRRWVLLFIAMFNKNIITYHLKYYQYKNNYDYLEEYDLKREYEDLPMEFKSATEPVYNFLNFDLIYKLFFHAAKDLDIKEGHMKTIKKGGMVFGSDGGKNYCQLENLLSFVLKNRVMIENYQEYRTIHKTLLTIEFTEQGLDEKVFLNRLELFVAIKYLNEKELNSFLSICFPNEKRKSKKLLISDEDKKWLVYDVLVNASTLYMNLDRIKYDDKILINTLVVLSIINFEETYIDFITKKLIEIISYPGNSFVVFEKINNFLGCQNNLFSTKISNDYLIEIINIIIRKIIEKKYSIHMKLDNIFGYSKLQNAVLKDEKIFRQLIIELSDNEDNDKRDLISSILLRIYDIGTSEIKQLISEFVLSINNHFDVEINSSNNDVSVKDLQKFAETNRNLGSRIVLELNLVLLGLKKLEKPVINKISIYLDRYKDGKSYDGWMITTVKLIKSIYEKGKDIDLEKLYSKAMSILKRRIKKSYKNN